MKLIREQIKKEITRLMEEKYTAPVEIVDALKKDLKLNPLIRFSTFDQAVKCVDRLCK